MTKKGRLTQKERAGLDHNQNIANLGKEITKKRNEIKNLITLLNTLIPEQHIDEKLYPSKWDYLKRMTKEALSKLQAEQPPFIKPTRLRVRTYAPQGGEAVTQQHMKDDCDINIIIKRHAETGNISHLNPQSPLYMDCSNISDLQGAISLVAEAEDNFATLPSGVRKACGNDPVEFINMLYSEAGTQELADAGLEYAANPPAETGPDTVHPSPKPKTIPAQQIADGNPPTGETATPESTLPPQGGK